MKSENKKYIIEVIEKYSGTIEVLATSKDDAIKTAIELVETDYKTIDDCIIHDVKDID